MGPWSWNAGSHPGRGHRLDPTRLLPSQAGACGFLSERPPLDLNKNNLQIVLESPKAT